MQPITETDILVAALTVYGEARGSTQGDREAIAHVIINRAVSQKWWGRGVPSLADHSLAAVCLKAMQFSCWNHNDPNARKLSTLRKEYKTAVRDPHCRAALKAVIDAVDGWVTDPTGGATHYLTTNLHKTSRAPSWSRGLPYVEIGAHRFFKGVE